jgi:hypothetical protein
MKPDGKRPRCRYPPETAFDRVRRKSDDPPGFSSLLGLAYVDIL